jgi:hypothetical protein
MKNLTSGLSERPYKKPPYYIGTDIIETAMKNLTLIYTSFKDAEKATICISLEQIPMKKQ